MKRMALALFAGLTICTLVASLISEGYGLTLSDLQVRITSQGRTATFQLYDTVAARQFFMQLPLKLELTNFREAQWMFCPPQKLNVTAHEAYHDAKKGELSYYEPWGDVFMLYRDFHAGDQMHRVGINLTGMDEIAGMSGSALIERNESVASKARTAMRISVKAIGKLVIFELNHSQAARDFYAQLPLRLKVENYGNEEKIFYPPKKLRTADTPSADPQAGTLAYYAPWGDVVMSYGPFGSAAGLYELGRAKSGSEHIQGLSGTIEIEHNK